MPTPATETVVTPTADVVSLAERFGDAGGRLHVAMREYEQSLRALAVRLETFDEDPDQPMNFFAVKQHVDYIGESDGLSTAKESVPVLAEDASFVVGAMKAARDAAAISKGGDDA